MCTINQDSLSTVPLLPPFQRYTLYLKSKPYDTRSIISSALTLPLSPPPPPPPSLSRCLSSSEHDSLLHLLSLPPSFSHPPLSSPPHPPPPPSQMPRMEVDLSINSFHVLRVILTIPSPYYLRRWYRGLGKLLRLPSTIYVAY